MSTLHIPPKQRLPALPALLTVYCFGTNSDSGDKTITAKLAAKTTSPKFITEGVGSGGWFKGHSNPGKKTRLNGIAFGAGTDYNVESAVEEIADYATPGRAVNLCGWSRGAVTCFKIAHELAARGMGYVDVNIFAFDPVPGDAVGNKDMWQNLSLGDNVKDCLIILAQHERRTEFHAAVPSLGGRGVVVDVMPGDHRSILQKTSHLEACYRVNKDRCAKFLRSHGTKLDHNDPLSDSQILTLYSEMLRKWGKYQSKGGRWFRNMFAVADRTIKGFDREEIGRLTPSSPIGSSLCVEAKKLPFFINNHHAQTFRIPYPRLHHLLLTGHIPQGWKDELDTMKRIDPNTGELVELHLRVIGFMN
jgi:hypothetical protein